MKLVPGIEPHFVEPFTPSHRPISPFSDGPALAPDLAHIAEARKRSPAGGIGIEAPVDEVARPHLHVEAEFLGHLARDRHLPDGRIEPFRSHAAAPRPS
jgi:hypothetical protein